MPSVVRFDELERVRQIAPDTVVYRAVVGHSHTFAYLYLTRSTYALVWSAPKDFAFAPAIPYTFVELLFNPRMETWRVEALNLALPKTRRHPGFFYAKATATLILSVGDKKSRVEYDLLNTERGKGRDRYKKFLEDPTSMPAVSFARYDSSVVNRNSVFDCCVTMESPGSADAEDWELLVKLPRNLRLTERELVWIVKHHRDESLKQEMDIKGSLAELNRTLDSQEFPQLVPVPV